MKKALSLILALALCLVLSVPALAVESTAANLTPEAAAAYKDIVDSLYSKYGAPSPVSKYAGTTQPYMGMCGGYVVDLGDGGCPELVVAFSEYVKKNYYTYVRVYTWNGASAVQADEKQLRIGNGRSWATYSLCQNGDTAWLDETWTVIGDSGITTYYHMASGTMSEFTPRDRAASSVELASYTYVYINNYDELTALLSNPGGSAPTVSNGPAVNVNGKAVNWPDAAPFIDENNRTMVPLRAVADAMGLTVNWDAAAREAIFTDGSRTIYFPIGSTSARTGDGGSVQMNTAAVIIDGRTYAPVRYLAEYFGHEVGWDAATRTVTIN